MTATVPVEDLAAFGRAIKSALAGADQTQTWLAAQMDVSGAAVSEWANGKAAPESPSRVFELERVLGVPPGLLSQHLGYVPVGEKLAPSLVEALRSDPSISDSDRNALLTLLRSMGVITE